jgi:large subunit ribosomal protein L15
MKLHTLKPNVPRQNRKRVGRGHGNNWGRCCGRGDKGQKSRSGYSRKPYFEGGQIPLFRRLPKRGFTNPNHKVWTLVNVQALEQNYETGETIDFESLAAKSVISDKVGAGLKILATGELTKTLTVKANCFSANARSKIEAIGGTCETV